MQTEIIPIKITKEIEQSDDLLDLILSSPSKPDIKDGDIIVITQKIISKHEGQIVDLSKVVPSILAIGIASDYGKDPRAIQVILDESKRIVRMYYGIIIAETYNDFICANAGVDESNVKGGYVTLLPKNSDASAAKLRKQIMKRIGKKVAVVVSDTFGRPFREGQINQAIGLSGISALCNYVGTKDSFGRILHVTAIAIADELCCAAELVMGKTLNTPIAIIRNYKFNDSEGRVKDLLRIKKKDLFR